MKGRHHLGREGGWVAFTPQQTALQQHIKLGLVLVEFERLFAFSPPSPCSSEAVLVLNAVELVGAGSTLLFAGSSTRRHCALGVVLDT